MLTEIFAIKNHVWQHPQKVKETITRYLSSQDDGLYKVEIKKFSSKRSLNQNSYYWLLVSYLAPVLGYQSKDACHIMLMENCGFGHYVEFRGKRYFERKSSTDLDVETFAKLIDHCFEIAAFLNEDREPEQHIILPKIEET